ncbi:hypothetical protein HNR44_000323 [Geomicrobium halophilum]|uniref:Uncharacterized protein n=1 Tax=Geomicrobium halophilum TaxID=549000 RepID=A0A841PL08_9BACL|nr:hypothetical protein [Geomicrobium halophilum]MBB6448374.1 hypothetical protein [Geomicrobium halophilum]
MFVLDELQEDMETVAVQVGELVETISNHFEQTYWGTATIRKIYDHFSQLYNGFYP